MEWVLLRCGYISKRWQAHVSFVPSNTNVFGWLALDKWIVQQSDRILRRLSSFQDTILDPRSLIAALMISFTVVDGVLARRSLNCADFICFLSHASQNINAHESAWSTYIIDECKAIATWPKIAGVVNKLEIGNLLVQILGELLTVNFVATHGITKFVIDKLMLLQGSLMICGLDTIIFWSS